MTRDRYSTREVGQLIGRSPGTIRKMIERGELEAHRLPGAGYRIERDVVVALAKEHLLDEAGARLSDDRVEKLIDQVIAQNEAVAPAG
jgi:excisionase family DNA binding protein